MDVNLAQTYLPTLLESLGRSSRSSSTLKAAQATATEVADQQELLTAVGDGAAATATFSALGQKLNTLSQAIQASGDEGVLSGFQQAMDGLLSGSDPLQTIQLINGMTDLAETDTGTFTAAFSTLNRLQEEGLGNATSLFTDTLAQLSTAYGDEGVTSLTAAVNSVLDGDYTSSTATVSDNLAALFSQYRGLLQTGASDETPTRFFDQLAAGLAKAGTGDEIAAFLTTGNVGGTG